MPALKIQDGTLWPDPREVAEMGWHLRYGDPRKVDALALAEVCSAYWALVTDPAMGKKLPWIRRAAGEVEP